MKKMLMYVIFVMILCSLVLVLPAAAEENGKIVYNSWPFMYITNPDGSEETPLFSNPNLWHNQGPECSPDGTRVAFYSHYRPTHSGLHTSEIYIINTDGTGETRLTYSPSCEECLVTLPWFPVSPKITFWSGNPYYDTFIMNPDGTEQKPLNLGISYLSWSPDGKKFVSSNWDDQEIYVMNTDGTGKTPLANGIEPVWSPDGTKIAFSAHGEIYVMNAADGSGQMRVTTNSFDDREPAWSPDSTKIAFTSDRDDGNQIYVVNADGSDEIRISTDYGREPTWCPVPAMNQPPVANAGQDQTVIEKEVVMFDGSGSTDADGTIVTYAWDFGDSNIGSGEMTTHTYTAAGTYTATLTITDNDGLTGSDTAVITVKTPGSLEVKSSPAKAKIYINGIYTEQVTKWKFDDMAPGDYKVYVTLEGYSTPATETVKVISGQTASLHFKLDKVKKIK